MGTYEHVKDDAEYRALRVALTPGFLDFLLVRDGKTDASDVFLKATAAKTGVVEVPSGTYRITQEIDIGSCRLLGAGAINTTIHVAFDGIGIRLSGSYGEVSDFRFEGAVAGENTGAIALVVGSAHKPRLNRCSIYNFTFAGLAFDGAQNMVVNDCFVSNCLYDYYITNHTATLKFVNCNASDFTVSPNTWSARNEPNCRAVMIGNVENKYIPARDPSRGTDTPSGIVFDTGILERFERHDHIIEIRHGYDMIRFSDIRMTTAKTALVLVNIEPSNLGGPTIFFDYITARSSIAGIDLIHNLSNTSVTFGPMVRSANVLLPA